MSIFSKMTAIANKIRSLTGDTEPLTLDDMSNNLSEVNSDVNEQTDLIAQIMTALEDKAVGGGIDTSDATATSEDILIGKTAYVDGEKVTGSYEGVELNFNIKRYSSEEEMLADTPMENTIGVITDVEITGYKFSATEPTDIFNGEVWINVGNGSDVAFDIVEDVTVYPISAKQYVSSTWVDVTAKSYQNSEWVVWWNGQLYTPGNEWVSETGGWYSTGYAPNTSVSATTVMSVAKGKEYIIFSSYFPALTGSKVTYHNAVDMTLYKTLSIDLSVTRTSSVDCIVYIIDQNGTEVSRNWLISGNGDYSGVVTFDISAISKKCYIEVVIWAWHSETTNTITIKSAKLT